jgi:DNA repair exonuclease SbcCD ATPase subunit
MVCDGVVKPIEVGGSGFEATFAALAVRSALASISSITRPSFLTLDEVDSTFNPENVDMLYELYNRILQNYSFIFHIVHDDSVVDRHDAVVTIVKEGHISKIEM